MKQIIEVTRRNLYHIDFDSIVAFFYAEEGAMGGDAGTLTFSAADGISYRLNYSRGSVQLGELCRAYHDGAFSSTPIPPLAWSHFYLGEGNHFLVHNIAVNKLLHEHEDTPEQIYLNWRKSLGTPLLSRESRYHWLIHKVKESYPQEGSDAEITWCGACQDEINLWTYWQGRGCLDPEILVVGQDWGDPSSKEGRSALDNIKQGRPYLENNVFPTDLNLAYLFHETFGMDLNRRIGSLFFTNLLLGYRTNGNSGSSDLRIEQDLPFFKELVNILTPRTVICLGKETFTYALKAFGVPLPYSGSFNKALDSGRTFTDIDGIRFWGMPHCGVLGCLNRVGNQKGAGVDAGLQLQLKDWAKIRDYREITGIMEAAD